MTEIIATSGGRGRKLSQYEIEKMKQKAKQSYEKIKTIQLMSQKEQEKEGENAELDMLDFIYSSELNDK